MTFVLDTSGVVWMPKPTPNTMMPGRLEWPMLDPFTQGYVEALFASLQESTHTTGWAFRYLHPETLAAILRDCERATSDFEMYANKPPRASGRKFWDFRQSGVSGNFPPLAPSLGDDGKVYLREAAS